MSNNFIVTIKYSHIDEKGSEKVTLEQYMFDALSYTEAETRMYKKAEEMLHGEFSIKSVRKQNIKNVFFFDQGEKWFKCKVSYVDIDEKSGKEKKVTANMMIEADNVKQAYERMELSLSGMKVPFDIPSIAESPVLEIFPYDANESVIKLTERMTKMAAKEVEKSLGGVIEADFKEEAEEDEFKTVPTD